MIKTVYEVVNEYKNLQLVGKLGENDKLVLKFDATSLADFNLYSGTHKERVQKVEDAVKKCLDRIADNMRQAFPGLEHRTIIIGCTGDFEIELDKDVVKELKKL